MGNSYHHAKEKSMGSAELDRTNFSNDISPTESITQPNPHLHDPSIIVSSMTTSAADPSKFWGTEEISETETRPEMQMQHHRLSTDKAIPHHPPPLIIPRASANTSQLPDSPSNISFPMSPSLPSSRPPAAPTPTPIFATRIEPHSLIQSLLPTADSVDGVQPFTTSDTTVDMISPNSQRNSPLSQLELSPYREGNGNLTKRISSGKSNQLEVKDIHDGSLDASIPLPASSKTPLINTKTRPSSLPYKQSPSSYDSSLFSLFFCCTRTGHSSSLSSGQPQPSPTTNVTSNSQSLTSSGIAGRVLDHGNTGSALGSLARFLPTMSRKGKENGKELKPTNEGKEQAKLSQKPGNFRKVSATNAGKARNASPGRIENQGTGKIDSPSLTSGSPCDPTANIITSVSPGKPAAAAAAAAARRRNSVFGHHNRPGKTVMLKPLEAEDMGKKCLVLDLDETLVHSSFKMIAQADYVVPVEIDSTIHNVYVLKRPGVDTFLKKVGELFEVVVFTASLAKYADPVLDMLDKHKVVKHRLFRESCFNHKGNYVKDLSQLGRDIRSVIIIDNSPTSYIFHPKNAVPITSWFNDPLDTELMDLMPFLEDLTMVENVTVVLDQGG